MSLKYLIFASILLALYAEVCSASGLVLVPEVTVFHVVNCPGDSMTGTGGLPSTAACNWSLSDEHGLTKISATSAVGEDGTSVFTQSYVSTNDELINPLILGAQSLASFTYFFVVEEIAEAPLALDAIPLVFNSFGHIERTGETFTTGSITIQNMNGVSDGVFIDNSTESLERQLQLDFTTGFIRSISTFMICDASLSGPGESICTSSSWTTLEFDQALFDETWGEQSFDLSEYYSIRFSSELVTVPLPSALGLYLLGLVIIRFRFG